MHRKLVVIPALILAFPKACQGFSSLSYPNSLIQRKPTGLRPLSYRAEDPEDDKSEWKVGDVYTDLNNLRQAIAFKNADSDLEYKERIETLDYIAHQRRPLFSDLQKLVVPPIVYSMLLGVIIKGSRGGRALGKILAALSATHFWTFVVVVPSFLYWFKRQHKNRHHQSETLDFPSELKGIDPEYYKFISNLSDRKDPKTSCQDYVLCLLEQWVSAIAGIALFGSLLSTKRRILAQCLTRVAAGVSLYHFPKLVFQLERQQQPRPLHGDVWALQSLLKFQWFPWMIACDLAIMTQSLSWSGMAWVYGCLTGSIATLRLRPELFSQQQGENKFPRTLIAGSAAAGWAISRNLRPLQEFLALPHSVAVDTLVQLARWNLSISGAVSAMATVLVFAGPICHMVSIQRILRIIFMHDLSLSNDPAMIRQVLESKDDKTSRFEWRYRLEWREPQRLNVVRKDLMRSFWYWSFFSGSVEDQMRSELRQQREAQRRGLTVWQRVSKEGRKRPDAPMPNRDHWKEEAMQKLAKLHKENYEQGNMEEDPLGIAVHRTFDIGLGFNFDHMSKLKQGETPSTRRLQARAAKSALCRAQQLYDSDAARSRLDKIDDPKERDAEARRMRRETETEIQLLARQLAELVPTDLSLADSGAEEHTKVQMYETKEYVKTSPTEQMVRSPQDSSNTVAWLKDKYEKTASYDSDSVERIDLSTSAAVKAEDDAFIKEFEQRFLDGLNAFCDDNDDQDDANDIEITLV